MIGSPDEWRRRAACRDMDVDLFFPDGAVVNAEAVAACARCAEASRCAAAGQAGRLEGFWASELHGWYGRVLRWSVEGVDSWHGTVDGWKRHEAAGTVVCRPCARAKRKQLARERERGRVAVQERLCACGCGASVESAGAQRIYASKECADAANARRERQQYHARRRHLQSVGG